MYSNTKWRTVRIEINLIDDYISCILWLSICWNWHYIKMILEEGLRKTAATFISVVDLWHVRFEYWEMSITKQMYKPQHRHTQTIRSTGSLRVVWRNFIISVIVAFILWKNYSEMICAFLSISINTYLNYCILFVVKYCWFFSIPYYHICRNNIQLSNISHIGWNIYML
jgi:hypothetical protein